VTAYRQVKGSQLGFRVRNRGPLRWAAVEAGKWGPRQQMSIKP
jgi:hypothetical protein